MENDIKEISLPEIYVAALLDVRKALRCVEDEFIEVRLFGSCVKGTYSAESDVDVLVITRQKLTDRERRSHIRELIDAALEVYRIESDVVFYTLAEFMYDKSDFTKSIQESFILLKGRG